MLTVATEPGTTPALCLQQPKPAPLTRLISPECPHSYSVARTLDPWRTSAPVTPFTRRVPGAAASCLARGRAGFGNSRPSSARWRCARDRRAENGRHSQTHGMERVQAAASDPWVRATTAQDGDSIAIASISNSAPSTASFEMATSVLAGGADTLMNLSRTSRKIGKWAISVR